MDNSITLSVIILNYKNPELTCKCLDTLTESVNKSGIKAEIIVVDNSAPETEAALERLLSKNVIKIYNPKNEGFAGANNQGIAVSKGEFVMLLNNDAFVNPESLALGLEYCRSNPKTGIWAPRLLNGDGTIQLSCANFPSIMDLLGEYLGINRRYSYPDFNSWNTPQVVDSLSGACMLVPRTVLNKVGWLDERFFFEVEDVDFCLRIKRAGYQVILDPRAPIYHLSGASQNWKWLYAPYLHKNRVKYFFKHYGLVQGLAAFIIIYIGLNLRRLKQNLSRRG